MKLAETIQAILEIEGNATYYSDVFINMLDDFGAFSEMPYAKTILRKIWDKGYNSQIMLNTSNIEDLSKETNRIIDNLHKNYGYDKDSLIMTFNELFHGLDIDLIITQQKIVDYTNDNNSEVIIKPLIFQGLSMGNSIRTLSSLLIRNCNYKITKEESGEIQMIGEFAGLQSSFIRLEAGENGVTQTITVGFYEEDETLRSLKGQLLMAKLNCDYGQPIEDPICGLKWLSEGGFVYILPFQEVVAVIYNNRCNQTSSELQPQNSFDLYCNLYSDDKIGNIEKWNLLHLLNEEFNPNISEVNGTRINNLQISKYNDAVKGDIVIGSSVANIVFLKETGFDAQYSIRSILIFSKKVSNWPTLLNEYKSYKTIFNQLYGRPSLESVSFGEYYQGEGDELSSLEEYSDGDFSTVYFNYAGIVLLEIRNSQVRIGYFHLPENFDDFGKCCFMGIPIVSPKQEMINRIQLMGGFFEGDRLCGQYNGYKSYFNIEEKFGKAYKITINIDTSSLNDIDGIYNKICDTLIQTYGVADFETGPIQRYTGRYAKDRNYSLSFKNSGGSITIIWSNSKNLLVVYYSDVIFEQLEDYSGDFHKLDLFNMFD